MAEKILNNIVFFGGFFSLALAAGQLAARRPVNVKILTSALFFNLGITQITSGLYFSGMKPDFPVLVHVELPFLFMIGPLLLLNFKFILKGGDAFGKRELFHFFPGFIAVLFYTIYHVNGPGGIQAHIAVERSGRWSPEPWIFIPSVLYLLAVVHISVYTLVFLARSMSLWNAASFKREPLVLHLFIYLLVSCIVVAVAVTGMVGDSITLQLIAAACMTAFIFWMYLLGQRFPEMLLTLRAEVERIRYEKSHLVNLDTDAALANLEKVMRQEKAYADEKLSLKRAAEMIGLNPHQLSELLNDRLGKSFKQYINEMRIDAAREVLLREPERTILSIAFEVGFNSQSAFYDAFVRCAGTTPNNFRKINS
jgi:AraC-like DNA-binding protein